MVENQLLPLPPPHHSETFVHTVSFLIWQFTFKVWNVQCSVLFILTKKNVETAKSFKHITIKDKNQSSQLDWCKITVTILNVCMYILHILCTSLVCREKPMWTSMFFILALLDISVTFLRKWHLNEILNNFYAWNVSRAALCNFKFIFSICLRKM